MTEVLLMLLAGVLLGFGSIGFTCALVVGRRDRADRAVVEEAMTRLEIDDLLHSDPREWVAEGEARALAEWAEENPAPASAVQAAEPTPTPDRQAGRSAPRPGCQDCDWEPIHVLEQIEPASWALVERCEAHDLEHAAEISRPVREPDVVPFRPVEPLYKRTRPILRVYGAECMAGQLPDFTCLCLRCQQAERPSVGGQLVDSGGTLLGLILMAWVALYRGLERVWDGMMRVLR